MPPRRSSHQQIWTTIGNHFSHPNYNLLSLAVERLGDIFRILGYLMVIEWVMSMSGWFFLGHIPCPSLSVGMRTESPRLGLRRDSNRAIYSVVCLLCLLCIFCSVFFDCQPFKLSLHQPRAPSLSIHTFFHCPRSCHSCRKNLGYRSQTFFEPVLDQSSFFDFLHRHQIAITGCGRWYQSST